MKEEWRTIEEFSDYEVSNFGEVRGATNCNGNLSTGSRKNHIKIEKVGIFE